MSGSATVKGYWRLDVQGYNVPASETQNPCLREICFLHTLQQMLQVPSMAMNTRVSKGTWLGSIRTPQLWFTAFCMCRQSRSPLSTMLA